MVEHQNYDIGHTQEAHVRLRQDPVLETIVFEISKPLANKKA
jgi:hypothetical protein